MLKNNYHTHMRFCNHAVGDVRDYCLAAIKANLEELGMTDHAPIPLDFMNEDDYRRTWSYENMKLEQIDSYLAQINDSRLEFKDKLKIYSGFETEYLYGHDDYYHMLRRKVNYLNLGIHFFNDNNGKLYDTYSEVDYNSLEYYVKTIEDALETGLFNTLVHPDLFMYDYHNKDGKREFDDAAINATKRIIEACIKNDIYVEINANGIKNDYDKDFMEFLYPYIDFWRIAKDYPELKIIVGVDAHDPKMLYGDHLKKIYELIDVVGVKVLDKMVIHH